METAGEEDWAKQLKAACSLEDSSEVPVSFLCRSSYTLMDWRVSCFLRKPTPHVRTERPSPCLPLSPEGHTSPLALTLPPACPGTATGTHTLFWTLSLAGDGGPGVWGVTWFVQA